MPNKYVGFVSDRDFLECVKWVCDKYPKSDAISMKELQRNVVDPFKMVFDLANRGMDVHTWMRNEKMRQEDKTINNKIGEFHQKLLGKVKGWVDLGVGDESKVDIKKADNSVFMEVKNKYNTMNSGATASCRRNLEDAVKNNPKAVAYWGFIVSRNGSSGEAVWKYGGRSDPRVRVAWGRRVYEIVTGNPNHLDSVWKALPLAISDLTKSPLGKDSKTQGIMAELFMAAFRESDARKQQTLF